MKILEFKCRCMCFHNQRTTGVMLMSGTWKQHMSFVHLIYPYGLHRVFYNYVPSEDSIFEEENCKKVVHRYNRKAHGF